jgi:hypothetical protein
MSESPVELEELSKTDPQTIGYHAVRVSEGVDGLRALAAKVEAGIDCDLYQLLYGIQLGLNL